MGGGGERPEGTLGDGAQAVGSGEPLDWGHFPLLWQSSFAAPLFCCQTCVKAQRAKPGASKVVFFFPFSCPNSPLAPQTDNTDSFPQGPGGSSGVVGTIIWESFPYQAADFGSGSQHLSGEEGWDSSCQCCALRGGYQPGHPLTWPSPIR